MYIFTELVTDIEELAFTSLGKQFLVHETEANILMFQHNGDWMTIDLDTRRLFWEPLIPEKRFTSRLYLRFIQWLDKGFIKEVAENSLEKSHAKWKHRKTWTKYVCSNCSFESDSEYRYCPHCGARINGD